MKNLMAASNIRICNTYTVFWFTDTLDTTLYVYRTPMYHTDVDSTSKVD
jgi:hypothetical protein